MARTFMRVTIDFEKDFDVTSDLKEMAELEDLTVEELIEEATSDPAWWFDSILSDLDYEVDVEFYDK